MNSAIRICNRVYRTPKSQSLNMDNIYKEKMKPLKNLTLHIYKRTKKKKKPDKMASLKQVFKSIPNFLL